MRNRQLDTVADTNNLEVEGLKAAEQVLGGEQHASADGLDYGGVCRMTQLDGGRCRISAQADDSMGSCGACSMTSLDSMSSCSSGEQDKNGLGVAKSSLSTGGRRMWIAKKKQDGSASSSTSTTMDGVHGDAGNLKKDDSGTLVGDPSMVDEQYIEDRAACEGPADGHKVSYEDEDMFKFLAVGTEIVWNEAKGMGAMHLFGERWRSFMQQKLFVLDFAFQIFYKERCESKGDLGSNQDKFRVFAFETMVERISEEVQIRYFLQQQGLHMENVIEKKEDAAQPECASGSTEDVPRDTGRVAKAAAKEEQCHAEDADGTLHGEEEGEPEYLNYEDVRFTDIDDIPPAFAVAGDMVDEDWIINKRFRRSKAGKRRQQCCNGNCQHFTGLAATGAAASLRGGANKYALLADEEEEEESQAGEILSCLEEEQDEVDDNDLLSEDADLEAGLDSSFNSIESGKSYYAEFFERKAALRGGAGGAAANATKNKQLTSALDALAAVCKSMESSQEEDSTEGVVKQIAQLAKQWQEKTPTKGEMRSQLRKLHVLLEKDCQRMADPEASREANAENTQQSKQSFYGDFVQRLRSQETKTDEWKTKGKGKGSKGKNQQKGKRNDALPRFDLMKIWPSRAITTWQVMEKELESGREPSGAVVIVENVEKMAEYQSLAVAHSLVNTVIMVTRAGEEEPNNVKNHQVLWLPYLSNLALARAVVATTTGVAADVKGVEPIKKEKHGPAAEKQTTLRIIVDLWLIEDEKRREGLKQHPQAALHGVAKEKLQELKTHGWSVGEHTISGYCTVNDTEVEKVLSLSGCSATFITRLRQDVTTQPPVTWVKVEENESTMDYYKRTQQLAATNGVAMARRSGGGAFLGILKEDDSVRNRAWSVSGIPVFWGPLSVRSWLQEVGWTVESNPKPPNGKFKTWAFQGRCEEHPLQMNFAYETMHADKVQHITIQHWQKVRTPTKEEKEKERKMRGTRWWSAADEDPIEVSPTQKFEPEVAPTVMETDDVTAKRTQEGKSEEATSPEKKKTKTTAPKTKPVLQGGSTGPDGSILINLGGGGDCGWRALAYMVATAHSPQGHDKAAERIETLSKTLRAKTVNYLVQHQNQWKESWTNDPLSNTVTEGGPPAKDFKQFVEEVLPRERRWVCGLTLAGAALLQQCTIIVWNFKGRADQTHLKEFWHRAAVIKGKETNKPVILPIVLHHGHYFALRQPALRKSWPKEWMNTESQEVPVNLTQDMADTQQLSTICRGGGKRGQPKRRCRGAPGNTEDVTWDAAAAQKDEDEALLRPFEDDTFTDDENEDEDQEAFHTPPRKVRKNEIDELLRTFSSRRSSKGGCSSDERMLRVCESVASASSAKSKKKNWACPICQETINIENRNKAHRQITEHLKTRHYAIFLNALAANSRRNRRGAGMGLVGLVQHVPFRDMKKEDWEEQAEYICPYCEMALPKLTAKKTSKTQSDAHGYLLRLSKKQHLRFDCPHREQKRDITMRQYYCDYVRKFRPYNEDWYKNTVYLKRTVEKGHEPVTFEFAKRTDLRKGKVQAVCKKCRKGLSAGDQGRRIICKGEVGRKDYSPGLEFWNAIKNNKMYAEAREKLGMTQQEIKKATEAAVHWCSKKGFTNSQC